MQLSELRTFLAIIETGSLVRASERLHVTQSTVTARLKSLENALGQRLINRTKSGATLTEAGIRLRRYAQTIDELWSQARQETALPKTVNFVCNLGCETDLWDNLGRDVFAHVNTAHPNSALTVWTGSHQDMRNWLKQGLCDVVISYDTPIGAQNVTLTDDTLIMVSDLANSPVRGNPAYIFVESGVDFGREHAIYFSDSATAKISFNSAPTALDHLLSVGGAAYLPQRIVENHLRSGDLYQLHDAPTYRRKTYLSARADFAFDPKTFTTNAL
tara:strand:+ start:5936 stop:6754 length:819 start_codon:yes stop_codon:yes gene_type:complete